MDRGGGKIYWRTARVAATVQHPGGGSYGTVTVAIGLVSHRRQDRVVCGRYYLFGRHAELVIVAGLRGTGCSDQHNTE